MARANGPRRAPGQGMNRAPARPPRTGRFKVTRTPVLIKTASHRWRTCVLITCMSQARYGRWPRSDVISWCRQNGRCDRSGTAGHPATWHDQRDGAGASGHDGGHVQHLGASPAWRSWALGVRCPRRACLCTRRGRLCAPRDRARAAVRVDAATTEPRLSRSLRTLQTRRRATAASSARPRLTNARAPC
jgi:hypothetical protein